MQTSTLDILRCPYCGGRLSLVASEFHRRDADEIEHGILGCQCCIFPIVSGIPVLHLLPAATAARDHIQAGRPDLARRSMFGLDDDRHAAAFEEVAAVETSTYQQLVDAFGPSLEGGYFLYRFSDPTYIVADAVVRAVAGTTLASGGRAVDLCGGSGHLTRSLLGLSSPPPVLADLYFAKVWLARRFTVPTSEAVCCDGNSPMPFARGAFRFAMCSDAFQFIWTKRQFIGEMARLIDGPGAPGTVLINHTHNEKVWSPSHGQPLTPEGYCDLFETLEPRLFAEANLFGDVVNGGPLDLSRQESAEALDRDPALTIVATRRTDVYRSHVLPTPAGPRGELRLNPLYAAESHGDRVRLRLKFPDPDYEDEYGACRQYLPETVELDRGDVASLADGHLRPELEDLRRRRVIVDLPQRYY